MGILPEVDEAHCYIVTSLLSGRTCFVSNNFSRTTFSCPKRPFCLSRNASYSVRNGGSLGGELSDGK